MIKINETPCRTSNNYGVNDVLVDEKVFERKINTFSGFEAKNASGIRFLNKSDAKNAKIISKILDNQRKNQGNFVKKIVFEKSQEETVVLNFKLQGDALVDTIEIEIKEGVNAKIVTNFDGNKNAYHNGLLKIVCQKDSRVDFAVMSDLKNDGNNFLSIDAKLFDGAVLNSHIIDFSSRYSIYNFYSNLNGDNAVSNLNVIYVSQKDNLVDLNCFQEIFGKNCRATIETVGALKDEAAKNFKGTISFVRGCKKSFGSESEYCLLLSDTAKSKALPMLLCGEEDVDGKHSTAIGRADEKQLFYVMSRGLDYDSAIRLLVKSKLNSLLNKLFDEGLKGQILEKIDGRI